MWRLAAALALSTLWAAHAVRDSELQRLLELDLQEAGENLSSAGPCDGSNEELKKWVREYGWTVPPLSYAYYHAISYQNGLDLFDANTPSDHKNKFAHESEWKMYQVMRNDITFCSVGVSEGDSNSWGHPSYFAASVGVPIGELKVPYPSYFGEKDAEPFSVEVTPESCAEDAGGQKAAMQDVKYRIYTPEKCIIKTKKKEIEMRVSRFSCPLPAHISMESYVIWGDSRGDNWKIFQVNMKFTAETTVLLFNVVLEKEDHSTRTVTWSVYTEDARRVGYIERWHKKHPEEHSYSRDRELGWRLFHVKGYVGGVDMLLLLSLTESMAVQEDKKQKPREWLGYRWM